MGGLVVQQIYQDGNMFEAAVLAITNEAILESFTQGIKNVTAVALAAGQPCQCSVPYSVLLAFSNLLAVACATEFSFKEAEEIKAYLADPSAFASAAPCCCCRTWWCKA